MAKRGGAFIFCRILAPPQCLPPPPMPQYLFILMGVIIFCRILVSPNASPPQTPQYLTILRTESGCHYVCRILAPPMPPSHDTTILNYLNDRERGCHYFLQDFGTPRPPPPPPPKTSQYVTILMTGRGGRQLQYPVRSKYIRILLLIL